MTPDLHTFWFKFEKLGRPTPLNLGCGITALDLEDAVYILRSSIFLNNSVPVVVKVIQNISVSDLERGHVLPNIGDMQKRGVWFPQGYELDDQVPQTTSAARLTKA